ncbi:MAG TPA: 23S rRNA (uracil(1939)-C(5))-methyltransferase RlmD [Clostridiales bacterium]|nr:23S rRNA (uracil(1939)-C(5))-methyltransferase RlmD [Clostridiales bacterium]
MGRINGIDNIRNKKTDVVNKDIAPANAVEKNKNYVVEITDMNHEGQGVGHIGSLAVFVDGGVIGENIELKVIKVAKNYAVGKLLKILRVSPGRTEPFCSIFKSCGGCSLQHINYNDQLQYKTNLVKETLKRIGKIDEAIVHDTIGMDHPFNYRNKAQFPVGLCDGKPAIGFYAKRSHEIVGSCDCGIQDPVSDKIREIFRRFIIDNEISIYDETTHLGLVRHLMVRKGFRTGEVMVVVVINGKDLPYRRKLVDDLISRVPNIKSIVLNINTQNTNVILGERNMKIYGDDTIVDYIGDFKFHISPLSFFQVNPIQTEVLYNKAMEYAQLTGRETVFDLFCGTGTIALFMAQKAGKVYGVEIVEDAILDARKNAKLNRVGNAKFIAGDVEKVIPELYGQGVRADVVVVDPPRKGCETSLLDTIADMGPERIVYVSCNPATLARDLMYLEGKGYSTAEVQPVDMFPWTVHVETVVLMSRVKE